jgi:mannose-6-phosphate isomerase-like protein (cupin superfamily)
MTTRNLTEAFASITDQWQPRRFASVNDYDVKIAKVQGEFIWHAHPDSDEFFLVVAGELTLQLRTGDVVLGPNDVYVVPKGVEHCPKADVETQIVMFELASTVNTGDAGGERTAVVQELD